MKVLQLIVFIFLSASLYAQTGSYSNLQINNQLSIKNKKVTKISNDTSLASHDSVSLVTEYAVKKYFDNRAGVVNVGHTFVVASNAAMLALSAVVGDIAVRTDSSTSFVLQNTPATTRANWVQLLFPQTVSLQAATDVGNTSTNQLQINNSSGIQVHGAGASTSLLTDNEIYVGDPGSFIAQLHGGNLEFLNSGPFTKFLKTIYTGSSGTSNYLPKNGGVFLTSINGITSTASDSSGAITIPIDTSTITNFYSKVRSLFSATSPITYNNGAFAINQSNTSTSGYLSSTDWNTFNGKQASLSLSNLTEATSSILTITGGTGSVVGSGTSIQVKQATTSQNGYLSSTDWNTFNGKVGSTRTISTTAPLLGGGDLSANRTLSIADAVADGSTKGAATFNASDFSSATGVISLDYTAAQSATTSTKGFLTATDWNTFNGKLSTIDTTNISSFSVKVRSLFGATAPIAYTNGTLSIANAAADGTTKGAATFNANDFDAATGVVALDYANGQKATTSVPGFLTAADWTTFNGKQATVTVTAPITKTGVSIGMVNQGTTTTVLHGNAAGNPAFSGVVSADISGRIDTSKLLITTLNVGDPLVSNPTNDTIRIRQSLLDSLHLKLTTSGVGAASLTHNANGDSLNIPTPALANTQALSVYSLIGGSIVAEPITGNISNISTVLALTDQVMRWVLVYLPTAHTITGVKWWQSVQGSYTASNYNGVAIWSLSAGTATLIDTSVNDGNIWKAAQGLTSKALLGTHVMAAGVYVVGLLYSRSVEITAPSVGTFANLANSTSNSGDFANSVKLNSSAGSQTVMPASKAMSTMSAASNQVYLALY